MGGALRRAGRSAAQARAPAFRRGAASLPGPARAFPRADGHRAGGRRRAEGFRRLPSTAARVDVLEGVLTDFWSDAPSRARGRCGRGGCGSPARAAVSRRRSSSSSRDASSGAAADRGDRVRLHGQPRAGRICPPRTRDVALPLTPLSPLGQERAARRAGRRDAAPRCRCPNRILRAPAAGGLRGRGLRSGRARTPRGAAARANFASWIAGMVARYRRGGLYHLLVVSGLHVDLAAGLVLAAPGASRAVGARAGTRAARVGVPVRPGGRRKSSRGARGPRRRGLPRRAHPGAPDPGASGARAVRARSLPRRSPGDLLDRHRADLRGGRRHRSLFRPIRPRCRPGRGGCSPAWRPRWPPSARRRRSCSGDSTWSRREPG